MPLPCHSNYILATSCRLSSTHLVHSLKCLFFLCFFSLRVLDLPVVLAPLSALSPAEPNFMYWIKEALSARWISSVWALRSSGPRDQPCDWECHEKIPQGQNLSVSSYTSSSGIVTSWCEAIGSLRHLWVDVSPLQGALWFSWKSSSGISHQRCLLQYWRLWSCSESCDGFRQQGGLFRQCQGWPDVEQWCDKASAPNHLQHEQSSAKKARSRREQRGGLGGACGTTHGSSGDFIGGSFSGKGWHTLT